MGKVGSGKRNSIQRSDYVRPVHDPGNPKAEPRVVMVPDYQPLSEEEADGRPRSLIVAGSLLVVGWGVKVPLKILVDTGAEGNIIRKGLVPSRYLQTPPKPITFVTASAAVMEGGSKRAFGHLHLPGITRPCGDPAQAVLEGSFYEADIKVDAILSLPFMAEYGIDIRTKENGIMVKRTEEVIWVKGIKDPDKGRRGQHDVNQVGAAQTEAVHGDSSRMDDIITTRMEPALQRRKRVGIHPGETNIPDPSPP